MSTEPFKLNLDIDAARIEKLVVDAILASSLGERVKKGVDDFIKEYRSNWDFAQIVHDEVLKGVRDIVRAQMVEPENAAKLRAHVANFLTDDALSKLVTEGVEAMAHALRRNQQY